MKRIGGTTMKPLFLRRNLPLVLCACLTITLVMGFALAKSAHAATTTAASCSNLDLPRGTNWLPGEATWWHTCKGTSLELTYQHDGNFVLYIGGQAKWATNTSSLFSSPDFVVFQEDGNLVVYHFNVFGSEVPAWASGTNGKGATTLALQHDGNLVIYTAQGKVLWASNTCCYS
jgi:hypothetical protein